MFWSAEEAVPAPAAARVRRHGLGARALHAAAALLIVLLLASGFALADALPARMVALLGGHGVAEAAHNALGLAFAAAVAIAASARGRAAAAWVRELLRLRRADAGWSIAFSARLLHLRRRPVPPHAGRLDPLQRLVLLVLAAAVLVAAASGVYLYWLPPAPRWLFILVIRAHVYVEWALLAALALHVFAGLGVLPTHRGITRSMFGDGTVPLATAERLWPEWTRQQIPARPAAAQARAARRPVRE